jgi:hypothetical protein
MILSKVLSAFTASSSQRVEFACGLKPMEFVLQRHNNTFQGGGYTSTISYVRLRKVSDFKQSEDLLARPQSPLLNLC